MRQKYEVFIGDFHLLIGESADFSPQIELAQEQWDALLEVVTQAFQDSGSLRVKWRHNHPETGVYALCHHFTHLQAAGGIVQHSSGNYLAIHRLGTWDLPKGKVEEGETIETTALREVEEECGINGLTLQHPLMKTWHGYVYKGRYILKTTHWFFLKTNFKGELKPQLEEDIQRVEWMDLADFRNAMSQSYPAIRLLVDAFFE